LIGILLGVVGILLTLYIYARPEKQREPICIVEPSRFFIRPSNMSLLLYKPNGERIKTEVTGVIFYFWNNGRLSIRRDEILQGIRIIIDDKNAEILDYRILTFSRPSVSPRLSMPKEKVNEVELDFRILEYKDGFVGQIAFLGNPNAKILVAGAVEGAPYIKANDVLVKEKAWGAAATYVVGLMIFGLISLYYFFRLLRVIMGFWLGLIKSIKARNFKQFISSSRYIYVGLILVATVWVFVGFVHTVYEKAEEHKQEILKSVPEQIFEIPSQCVPSHIVNTENGHR
jgi:hypothetical protein